MVSIRDGSIYRNIVDISPVLTYRYQYHIGTLDIGFFDMSISYRWQVKYG